MITRPFALATWLLIASACAQPMTIPDQSADQEAAASRRPTAEPTTTAPAPSTTSTAPTSRAPTSTAPPTSTTTSTTSPITTTTDPPPEVTTVAIRIKLERRVTDTESEGFESFVEEVLRDPRGWQQAGFLFSFSADEYDYTVVLAEPSGVDEMCAPYRTGGQYSCQIGPVVALNAERWRHATGSWPASLAEYRTMLVNHEVGHLLGQHHPAAQCSEAGESAAVMSQQSKGVGTCVANPWPLPWEITCASQHLEPLAPPYEPTVTLTCGPDG